ncbi:hypothetical protein N7532_006542 [Penicillium argentinense]|uniref:Uncharacterized protein n=1 Tax=Penicillium argentinense TaxID=1131581 RepID=A0A9W9KBE4_9EURO|nr:uncharacterized protein N7532_006542 [Penicillium argentinense]KAJ5099541.1 hypothetical protein N7532_006542 [Penicillium argentinense]
MLVHYNGLIMTYASVLYTMTIGDDALRSYSSSYEVSSSVAKALAGVIASSSSKATHTSEGSGRASSSASTRAIAGGVVGGLIGGAAITATVIISYLRKKKRQQKPDGLKGIPALEKEQQPVPPTEVEANELSHSMAEAPGSDTNTVTDEMDSKTFIAELTVPNEDASEHNYNPK